MNIFMQELKEKLKSSSVWAISVFLLTLMFMSFFQAFASNTEVINLVMENYPKEMLKAAGMSGVDLSTVTGYFTTTILFIQICLAIQASNYGLSILSIEERERTADFLMTKPVTRTKIFVAKSLAAFLTLTLTNVIVWGSTFLSIEIFKGEKAYDVNIIIKMLLPIVLFQLFFFGIGMLISVSLKKIKSILPFSMALSFGMYIISAFGAVFEQDKLSYITPFKYFDPNYLVINGNYETKMIYICIGVIIISLISSYYLYIKRNIHYAT